MLITHCEDIKLLTAHNPYHANNVINICSIGEHIMAEFPFPAEKLISSLYCIIWLLSLYTVKPLHKICHMNSNVISRLLVLMLLLTLMVEVCYFGAFGSDVPSAQ